MKKNISRKSM